ncbi:9564_t:CDS:1, partial [Gigaspora margarita]
MFRHAAATDISAQELVDIFKIDKIELFDDFSDPLNEILNR